MLTLDVSEVARRWSELVRLAESGEAEIVVTRNGRPAALLTHLDTPPRSQPAKPDFG